MYLSSGGISDYIIHLSIFAMTRIISKTGHIYDLTDYKFLNSKVEQNVVPFYSEKKK